MESVEKEALKRIQSLSECCICLMTYTDPRMLPCFHTACLKCFEDLQSKNTKNPGDVLPCPLCRETFTIPPEGMKGLQKNFFIESLMEVTKAVNLKDKSMPCSSCNMLDEASDVTEATMRCLNCCEIYCLRCSKIHKNQKFTRDHEIVEINDTVSKNDFRNMFPVRYCKKHFRKVLDYYCSDCKTVVCVSCFVEDHQTHKRKDVSTVDKDFRQSLEKSCLRLSVHTGRMLSKKTDIENEKKDLLSRILETENAIKSRSNQLKVLIDEHTQLLLNELSLLKQKHQKIIETEIDDIDRKVAVLESFMTYCSELKKKGSPSSVCSVADSLIAKAKSINKENEEYLNSFYKSVVIEFIAAEENALLQNVSNVIGRLSECEKQLQSRFFIIGISDGYSISNEVIKIILNQPEDVSSLQPIPTTMQRASAAAVYFNSILVTGIGVNCDEIWKFDATTSNWKKCASMVKGRRQHSVAFVDHVLYICGGYVDSSKSTLDDVEVYDAIDDKCSSVGKLTYAIKRFGNCVSFKSSLYIFGGSDTTDEIVSMVQVYDTKINTCALLSKPIPRPIFHFQAALWENTVILLGPSCCMLFNFDTETWALRDHFKTDVICFGLVVKNDKIFVIGGSKWRTESDGKATLLPQEDIRCIPVKNILNNVPIEWTRLAKLPAPSLVHSFGQLELPVQY